jgi:hypothetical protein
MSKKRLLGKLPPQHTFFLNPYADQRFTVCPKCGGKTRIRKFPFAIYINPQVLMTLNMSGPYCPVCDLIILHQDKVEQLLTAAFLERQPSIVGNDYLIIGTVERDYWHKASTTGGTYEGLFESLHDFKQVVTFEPQRWGWMPDAKKDKR